MIPKKQDIVISDRTEGMVESSASYYQESQLFFYIINGKTRRLSPTAIATYGDLGACFLGTVRRLAYASKR